MEEPEEYKRVKKGQWEQCKSVKSRDFSLKKKKKKSKNTEDLHFQNITYTRIFTFSN